MYNSFILSRAPRRLRRISLSRPGSLHLSSDNSLSVGQDFYDCNTLVTTLSAGESISLNPRRLNNQFDNRYAIEPFVGWPQLRFCGASTVEDEKSAQ
ncbi:unnamed protein product [Protopolystoma xenopodis]|uniref:Uncharacterized protein n=1 Tax=Protopolystoma xenopodis TaxID=117903 RepID=A0A3S5CLL9_9PLAT|nr:unnamed protein product [Protopolystoma xenopodis]